MSDDFILLLFIFSSAKSQKNCACEYFLTDALFSEALGNAVYKTFP